MATRLQLRRGTEAENNAYTGAVGEITIDTTNDVIRIHDGVTPGGFATVMANSTQTLITGNLLPAANVTYNLGNSTNYWNDLYLSGNTIFLGPLQLKATDSTTFSVFQSNGSTLANIAVGSIDVASISSGTTSFGIPTPSGNAVITVGGTSNVLEIATNRASLGGALVATGNITGSYILGNGSQLTGIDATSIQNGTANVKTILNGNVTISAAGTPNVVVITSTGANIAGTLNVTGNANVGNLGTDGNITASYLFGNGSQLSGIDASGIQNGTSNVKVVSSGGNVTTSVGGQANVLIITSTGANVTGTLNATGNANVGNIGTTNAVLAGSLTGVTTINATGNANVGNISATNIIGTLETASQTNITAVGTLGTLNVTGNANVGNLGTNGNITASYLFGNGSQLSGIDASGIQNGTSNVKVVSSGGNVTTSVGGTANVLVVSATGANITGTLNATGNANVGNLGATNIVGTLETASQTNITSVGTLTSLSVTGNISGGNLSGTSIVGTLTTAAQTNITSVGTLSSLNVTGNISGGNLSGTNIVGTLTTAAQTNITSVGTLTSLSVTGNIAGGNVSGTLLTGTLATAAQPNVTSLGTLTSLTIQGNVNQTGNLNITGNINATGNLNYQNVTDLVVGDPLIFLGANNTANLDDLGFIVSYDDGLYQHGGFVRNHLDGVWGVFGNVVAEPTTVVDWGNAIYQPFRAGAATFAGANINGALTGATTGAFSGNVSTGNVSGATGTFTNVGGTLTTGAQTNITSVGTLGSLSVTGNITGGNLSGINIVGTLTTAAQTNITSVGTLGSLAVTGNITSGNLSGTNIVGTLTTAAQTNITSVGTLGSLTVTANISSGNISATTGTFTNVGGTITTAAQTNITSVGTLTSLTVTGNVAAGNVSGTLLTGTLATAAQPNITSLGTLTSLTITGNSTAGNYTTAGQVTATGNITTSAYLKGDGSQITNLAVSVGNSLTNGNSNVFVNANANIAFSSTGVANVVTISPGALALGGGAVFANPKSSSGSGSIPTGVNAMLIGPYVVSDGDTITAPTGSTLIVI